MPVTERCATVSGQRTPDQSCQPIRSRAVQTEAVRRQEYKQLSLWFDLDKSQLVVHLLCARDLIPTPQAVATVSTVCNSYCRIRLLPGRDDSTLKYSKLVARTNHPRWNQQFLFADYTEDEIAQHDLELTVWNCALSSNEQTLMGEVIGSMTGYESQMRQDSSRMQLASSNEGATLTGQSTDGRGKSEYMDTGLTRSGDYSDIDDKTYGTAAAAAAAHYSSMLGSSGGPSHHRGRTRRGHSRHVPSRPDYGPEELMAHSDVSELSDISELSRMSLHTSQSEKGRFHSTSSRLSPGGHYPGLQYTSGSGVGGGGGGIGGSGATMGGGSAGGGGVGRLPVELHQQISPESSSKSDRPQEPDDTSDDFSLRQRRLATGQRDEGRLAKESSSSECGSGMVMSSMGSGGAMGTMYGKSGIGMKDTPGSSQMSGPTSRGDGRKPRPSIGHKFSTVLGRSHKSSSTSNLDKKTRTSFQRSEEVLPSTDTQFDEMSSGDARRGRLQTQLSLRSGKTEIMGAGDGGDLDSCTTQLELKGMVIICMGICAPKQGLKQLQHDWCYAPELVPELSGIFSTDFGLWHIDPV
ncbi:unnamed protein product [Echinostoma caproni]|uniref:C2 domain-containing protein n=1 Tax=Echinostoma caproni TaxID=27848 RepID=A0A183AI20_9TREM|nr:unnamed protein product [Echinostoma caproni]